MVKLIADHWPKFSSVAAKEGVVNVTPLYRRGWSWIIKGDGEVLSSLSKVKPIFEIELSGDPVTFILAQGTSVTCKAYAVEKILGRSLGDYPGFF